MRTKATKIDATTWSYRGFTITKCVHSRTYQGVRADGEKTYARNRLRDAVTDIDCFFYAQWERTQAAARTETN